MPASFYFVKEIVFATLFINMFFFEDFSGKESCKNVLSFTLQSDYKNFLQICFIYLFLRLIKFTDGKKIKNKKTLAKVFRL